MPKMSLEIKVQKWQCFVEGCGWFVDWSLSTKTLQNNYEGKKEGGKRR